MLSHTNVVSHRVKLITLAQIEKKNGTGTVLILFLLNMTRSRLWLDKRFFPYFNYFVYFCVLKLIMI